MPKRGRYLTNFDKKYTLQTTNVGRRNTANHAHNAIY